MALPRIGSYGAGMIAPGNLADPAYEPSDEDLGRLMHDAFSGLGPAREESLTAMRARIERLQAAGWSGTVMRRPGTPWWAGTSASIRTASAPHCGPSSEGAAPTSSGTTARWTPPRGSSSTTARVRTLRWIPRASCSIQSWPLARTCSSAAPGSRSEADACRLRASSCWNARVSSRPMCGSRRGGERVPASAALSACRRPPRHREVRAPTVGRRHARRYVRRPSSRAPRTPHHSATRKSPSASRSSSLPPACICQSVSASPTGTSSAVPSATRTPHKSAPAASPHANHRGSLPRCQSTHTPTADPYTSIQGTGSGSLTWTPTEKVKSRAKTAFVRRTP